MEGGISSKKEKLITQFRRLYQEVKHTFSRPKIRRVLGTAAIFLGLTLGANNLEAQSFAAPIKNPFGMMPDTSGFAFPTLADIDSDGDQDMFIGEIYGDIKFYENTGNANTPVFGASVNNPFNLQNVGYIASPTTVDLDGDGDLDMLVGFGNDQDDYGYVSYFENTGTATAPNFAAPITNPFGLTNTYILFAPTVADLDNDGDFDLMVGEYSGATFYFENIGTPTAPAFGTAQDLPFGLTGTLDISCPALVDLDMDGDSDLFIGEYYGNLNYFQNTGNASAPAFAAVQQNPFGLSPTYYYAMPTFADIDNDGDQDLFVAEYYGEVIYFENTQVSTSNKAIAIPNLQLSPNPASQNVRLELNNFVAGQTYQVQVLNTLGQVVFEQQASANSFDMDVSNFAKGVYVISIQANDKRLSGKLVVE